MRGNCRWDDELEVLASRSEPDASSFIMRKNCLVVPSSYWASAASWEEAGFSHNNFGSGGDARKPTWWQRDVGRPELFYYAKKSGDLLAVLEHLSYRPEILDPLLFYYAKELPRGAELVLGRRCVREEASFSHNNFGMEVIFGVMSRNFVLRNTCPGEAARPIFFA